MRVATPLALYRLERGTARALDRQDAAALRERFDLSEEVYMSVQRFRSIEEMNSAPILAVADHAFERFLRQCARYWAIAPRRNYPRGVYKFRLIEEAQAAQTRGEPVSAKKAPPGEPHQDLPGAAGGGSEVSELKMSWSKRQLPFGWRAQISHVAPASTMSRSWTTGSLPCRSHRTRFECSRQPDRGSRGS